MCNRAFYTYIIYVLTVLCSKWLFPLHEVDTTDVGFVGNGKKKYNLEL